MKRRTLFLVIVLLMSILGYCQDGYHIVKAGDTPSGIARQYGLNLNDLLEWNDLGDSPIIRPGQRLVTVDPNTRVFQDQEEEQPVEVEAVESIEESPEETSNTIADASLRTREPVQTTSSGGGREGRGNGGDTRPGNGDDNPARPISWIWLLLGLMVGSGGGIFLYYLLYVKKLKAEYKCTNNELTQTKYDLANVKTSAGSELSRLRSKIQSLEHENKRLFDENISLGEDIDRLKAAQCYDNVNNVDAVSASTSQIMDQTSGLITTLYADAIIEGYFVKTRETPNEDSIFVLHLKGEDLADFTIFDAASQRVMLNPSFLEGCEKQILGDTMRLEIVSEGRAQREVSNGKWKVISKLNVIIK